MESIDKIFFTPGDLVTIKHELPNKPVMLVKGKETKTIRGAEKDYFVGIRCVWFTADGTFQEEIFSTKDLSHVTKDKRSPGYIQTEDCPDCGYPTSRNVCSKHKAE